MSETNSFPSQHPWDRNFFLLMISFAWLALLSGFINDAFLLSAAGRFHFPWIGCNSNCRAPSLSCGFPENIGDEVEFLTA